MGRRKEQALPRRRKVARAEFDLPMTPILRDALTRANELAVVSRDNYVRLAHLLAVAKHVGKDLP